MVTMSSSTPNIHLLLRRSDYAVAWEKALDYYELQDRIAYIIHDVPFSELSRGIRVDLIVSPATSYDHLDGGFDDAITRALSPQDDCMALTRYCQSILHVPEYNFQHPMSNTLVELPPEFTVNARKPWGVRFIGHCPTTCAPNQSEWDTEVAYERMIHLLAEIARHNQSATDEKEKIKSILLTPMGTATGLVKPDKWAHQTVLAFKHHLDNIRQPNTWNTVDST